MLGKLDKVELDEVTANVETHAVFPFRQGPLGIRHRHRELLGCYSHDLQSLQPLL